MKLIPHNIRYGLLIGTLALVLPIVASSTPSDCQNSPSGSKQPGFLEMHNEMMMPMPQVMLPPPPGMMPPRFQIDANFMPPFLRDLKLTESQQDKMFELMHSQMPTMRTQFKVVRKIAEELNRQALSDNYNPAEVKALADKLASAIADMVVLHTAADAKFRALLTPEQRKQADEMRSRLQAQLSQD